MGRSTPGEDGLEALRTFERPAHSWSGGGGRYGKALPASTIRVVRAYSHALLTWTVARRLRAARPRVPAVAGAVAPDLPVALGAAWLFARRFRFDREEFREEVCSRTVFRGPDAALHSALPAATALAAYGAFRSNGLDPTGALLAFLLGWAGHVLSDALTHAEDARPLLWPLSNRRFRGPVSYWDPAHHARAFTLLEHATLLLVATLMLRHVSRER